MNRLTLILVLLLQFILVGCKCECGANYDTDVKSNTTVVKSSLYVFADGCTNINGEVDDLGYPTASCDASGQYVNRGRWVKVPKASVTKDSIVNLGIQSSIFYCSTGYDNQNIFPYYIVTPSSDIMNVASDNSQLPVKSGQMVVIEVVPDDDSVNTYSGVALGNNASSVTEDCSSASTETNSCKTVYTTVKKPVRECSFTGSPPVLKCTIKYVDIQVSTLECTKTTTTAYDLFLKGSCRGYNAFGLTIYVGEKEIVNLDQTYVSNAPYYPYAQSRTASIFSYIEPNDLSNFYTYNYQQYQVSLSNHGDGKYSFMVPEGVSGVLGFKIAEGIKNIGNGKYTINVMTTPPACYIEQSQAYNSPDNRGALQMLVTSTNPNTIDNAISSFDALNGGNEIVNYRKELNQYISTVLGIKINTNASALSNLVTSPNLSPVVILAPNYNFIGGEVGDIWLKVRDDYYSDNVGEYYVTATVTTRKVGIVSQFLTDLITPIVDQIYSLSEILYKNFMTQQYLNIIRMALLIYIMFYGAEFALGLVNISSQDLIIRILKLAVVIEIFNPSSFDFFDRYFFQLFKAGSEQLTEFVTGDYTDSKAGMFGFLDDIFNVYFSAGTWIKIAALIPDIVGILFLLVLVYIIFIYLLILARVIVSYLLVIVGVSLLVALAPMFFPLMLFERTRKYFDNWVKNLFGYAIQPVLLFGSLYIMTIIFLQLWNNLMDFDVCWGGVIKLYFPLRSWTQGFLDNVNLGCIQYFKVTDGIKYINIFGGAFALLVFTLAINNMMSHIPEISDRIADVYTASAVSSKASEAVQKGMDTAGQAAGAVMSGVNKLGNFASNLTRGGSKGAGQNASGALMEAKTAARGNKVDEMDKKQPRSRIGKTLKAAKDGVKAAGKAAGKAIINSMVPEQLKKKKREEGEGGSKLDQLKEAAMRNISKIGKD